MDHKIYHLHAISGLHVGTGQGIGVIDMPIARERASNLPQVPGSGIKGVLRDECKVVKPKADAKDEDKESYNDYLALFGPESGDDASNFAGALAVGDARLLCLPIRSWKGTFAWVTCPMILQRYKRDDKTNTLTIPIPTLNEIEAKHSDNTELTEKVNGSYKVFLEDLDLNAQEGAEEWAEHIATKIFIEDDWKTLFKERFLIVHDNVFDFLSETATEIRARIKIEDGTRTVKSGALWYEEYLPAETILWGIIGSDNARDGSEKEAKELLKILPKNNTKVQMGGNATVGAGQVRWIMGGE